MLVEAMESELLRYERLAEDLSGFIVAGNLRPGERLPSVPVSYTHLTLPTNREV